MEKKFLHMTRQLERLRPQQIREAMSEKPVIWFPLGTIEWHCEHLPVGLDGLTAHGLCLKAAERAGGLVLPALFFGTGGGHGDYPWTIMMQDHLQIENILMRTAERLQEMDVRQLVIFSGHFADEQLEMIDRIAKDWNALNATLQITATAVNRASGTQIEPDHAGEFETLLMNSLSPKTVKMDRLPTLESEPDDLDRHNPKSPIWGVIGQDPRSADLEESRVLLGAVTDWLTTLVH
jgi:creatinine amidohydrolase